MSKILPKKPPTKQVVKASDSESSEVAQPIQKTVASKKDKLHAKIQDKQPVASGAKASAKNNPQPQVESEDDKTPPTTTKKQIVQPAKKNAQPQKKTKEPVEESEQDSEPAPVKKTQAQKPIKKGSAELKKVPQSKGKQQQSSEQSDSEEPRPAKKTTPVLQAQKQKKPQVVAKSVEKKATQKQVKSESEEDSEEEPPVSAKGKGTKAATSPKQAPKPSPKQAPKPSPKLGATKKPIAKKVQQSQQDESEDIPSPKKSKVESAKATKQAQKPSKDSDEDEDESEEIKPTSKGKQVAQAKPAFIQKCKKAPQPESDEDEDEEEPQPVKQVGKHKISKDSTDKQKKGQKEQEKGQFEVYVGGLAWAMAEADLAALFAQCGEVLEVRLLRKDDGKSKGIAFVKFSTQSARTKALALNESEQFGRPIKVEKSTGKAQSPTKNKFNNNAGTGGSFTNDKPIPDVIDSCTIFVGNMSYASTPETIRQFFNDCGEVKDARIATDKESGKARGFGYVEFYDTQSVRKALGKKGGELDGRLINIDVAAERKKEYGGGNSYGGGNRGNFGGNRGGSFRGNNSRGASVALDEDDKNAKKGNIGVFKGTITKLA